MMTVDPTKYILSYLLVVLLSVAEVFPMSLSAMVGAAFAVLFGLSDGLFKYHEVLAFIDLELIALLIAVMIVVEVVDRYGTFRYVALKVVRRVAARPQVLLVVTGLLSALTSLLLSDEAAILLFVAILGSFSKIGGFDPVPFAITSAIMVNLGGTGTLIGSLPNMAIGLRAGFDFVEFASYLLPVEFMLYGITLLFLYRYFKPQLKPQAVVEFEDVEVSRSDALRGAILLAFLLSSLILAGFLEFPISGVALVSALIALAVSGFDTTDVFRRLDWDTIFFTAAFTVIIEVLGKAEALKGLILFTQSITGGSLALASLFIFFASGLFGLFIPNLIMALSFIPLIDGLNFPDKRALWAGLALGSNLSGVGLPVSSFVIVMTLGALRREGYRVNPWTITKVGLLVTFIWLVFSATYLLLRFNLLFG